MFVRPLIIAGLLFASSCVQAGPTTAETGGSVTGFTYNENSVDVVAVSKGDVPSAGWILFSKTQGSQGDASLSNADTQYSSGSETASNNQGQGGTGGSGGGSSGGSGGGSGGGAGGGSSGGSGGGSSGGSDSVGDKETVSGNGQNGLLNPTDGLPSDATLPVRDVPANDVVQVPEPATAALLLVGLAGVGLFGRRRK